MNKHYQNQVFLRLLAGFAVLGISTSLLGWSLWQFTELEPLTVLLASLTLVFIAAGLLSRWLAKHFSAPLTQLAQKIEHITAEQNTLPPVKNSLGSQLISHTLKSLHNVLEQAHSAEVKKDTSAKQIARTLNILPYPVFGINHAGQIALANQAAAELLKTEAPRELLGKNYTEVIDISKDGQPILSDWIEMQQASAVNAEQQWLEVPYTGKNWRKYNFDIWARFIRSEETGVETSVMLVDRTLERDHEDMKVDFVAMAAHDLRAPVTVIKGYIETLQDELEEKMDEDQKNFMEKLEASASQLSGFINNILNVSKVDKGKLNLSFQECEWGTVLRQTIDQLQVRAKAHGKFIEFEIDSALPHVAVDPISIIEVINNLVDNAIKYSGKENQIIRVTSKLNSKSEIETTVQDFGVGIPDSLVGKLFTKYYRSHRTQKEFGGTGLGLFISKAIIEAHKGHVWAKSKVGEGSTFGFSLPTYEKSAARMEENDQPTITRGSHGWIKNHSLYRR